MRRKSFSAVAALAAALAALSPGLAQAGILKGHCGKKAGRHHAQAVQAPCASYEAVPCAQVTQYAAPVACQAQVPVAPVLVEAQAPPAVPARGVLPHLAKVAPPVTTVLPVAPPRAVTPPPTYYIQSYYYAPPSPCANGQCGRR